MKSYKQFVKIQKNKYDEFQAVVTKAEKTGVPEFDQELYPETTIQRMWMLWQFGVLRMCPKCNSGVLLFERPCSSGCGGK